RLLGVRGPILMAGQTILIAVRVEVPNAAPDGATADIDVHGALLPLVPGERGAIGNGYTYRVVVRRRPYGRLTTGARRWTILTANPPNVPPSSRVFTTSN